MFTNIKRISARIISDPKKNFIEKGYLRTHFQNEK